MKYQNISLKLPYYCQLWFIVLLFLMTPLTLTASFVVALFCCHKRHQLISANKKQTLQALAWKATLDQAEQELDEITKNLDKITESTLTLLG